jgi:hypothetical protein
LLNVNGIPKSMMDNPIGCVTCNFGRLPILKIFCAGINRLREQTNLPIPTICVGDADGKELCEAYGIEHIEHKNKPLTGKFNTAVYALKNRVDYCMILGSDNVISTETFLRIQEEADKGTDLIGLDSVYFYAMDDVYSGKLLHFRHTKVLGVGRTVAARVLDNLHWRPFTREQDRAIDTVMLDAVRPFVRTSKLLSDGFVFDLKTSHNLNGIGFWAKKLGFLPNSNLLFSNIGEEEARLIREYLNR